MGREARVSVPALKGLLQDENEAVRRAAENAIRIIEKGE
jgi:HEAT repeat protein